MYQKLAEKRIQILADEVEMIFRTFPNLEEQEYIDLYETSIRRHRLYPNLPTKYKECLKFLYITKIREGKRNARKVETKMAEV